MKKLLYPLGILVASAFVLSSCEKEQASNEEVSAAKMVTVSFTAEKAGLDTRTAAVEDEDGVSYIWTDEDVDNIKLFTVKDGSIDKEITATATKVSGKQLTISATVEAGNTYTFRAVLGGKWTNNGDKPYVPDTQNPKGMSNFDPSADVLISDDIEVLVEADTELPLLTFFRQIAVSKMTLKSLAPGDIISKVVITSDKNLTGYFDTGKRSSTGAGKTIRLNYSSGNVVPEDGMFPVYFTSLAGEKQTLTVEVTTDKYVYSKRFAEGKTIDFTLGIFTKFNLALPDGVANSSLILPLEDSMEWAVGSDGGSIDLNVATQGDNKIYDSASTIFKGSDGMRLGNSTLCGSLTTNAIDLSSSYNISIDAKAYGSDKSTIEIYVDDEQVLDESLKSEFDTYHVNLEAATSKSVIKIAVGGKRGYVKNFAVRSGDYVVPPVIKVDSDNPLEVPNAASSQTIIYTVENSTYASLVATTDADWIMNLDYSTPGQITFDVAAQEKGASSRSAEIILSYEGAKPVPITVNQAAGAGGITTYETIYTVNSKESVLTEGTYPAGSSASFINTDKNSQFQLTAGSSMTLTLNGYAGLKITGLKLSMRSNTKTGAGRFSFKAGETVLASIESATNFDKWYDNTSYGTDYRDVNVRLDKNDYQIQSGEKVVITITGTTNSLYCESFTITSETSQE